MITTTTTERRWELLAELRDACEQANWDGRPTSEDRERIAEIQKELATLPRE